LPEQFLVRNANMKIRSSIRTLSLYALISAGVALSTTQVATAAQAAQVAVSYRDLNLNQPADARILYTRLQRAAESVCPAVSNAEVARYAAYQRCVSAALDTAVQQVGAPELVALHHAAGEARSRG
jgi:UrcA family protein